MTIGFDSVSQSVSAAFPGMQASAKKGDIASYVNSEASAEIRFGIMVGQGTADKTALLLAATTDKLVGVVRFRHAYVDTIQLGTTGLKPKVVMDVAERDELWVIVEEDVTPSSAVYVRAVAGVGEIAGAFRATADGGDTILLKFARFTSSSTLAPDGTTKVAKLAFDINMRAGS